MSDYNGGDIVRTHDGREARVIGRRMRVGPGVSSDQHKVRYDDMSTEYLYSHEIAELLTVGPHDYWKGEQRGVCRRCGVKKRDHGTVSSARGMEGKWATPHPQ